MSADANPSPRAQVSEAIRKLWWIPLLRGVVLLALGCYALFFPRLTAFGFTQVVGAFLIVDGVLAIIAAILGHTHSRIGTIVRGVLAILIGGFVFANPVIVAGVTVIVIMYMIAVGVIIGGVVEIATAIRVRKEIEGEGWMMAAGALSVIFGVLLMIAPLSFGVMIIQILGGFAIFFGITMVALALRMRRFGAALAE